MFKRSILCPHQFVFGPYFWPDGLKLYSLFFCSASGVTLPTSCWEKEGSYAVQTCKQLGYKTFKLKLIENYTSANKILVQWLKPWTGGIPPTGTDPSPFFSWGQLFGASEPQLKTGSIIITKNHILNSWGCVWHSKKLAKGIKSSYSIVITDLSSSLAGWIFSGNYAHVSHCFVRKNNSACWDD